MCVTLRIRKREKKLACCISRFLISAQRWKQTDCTGFHSCSRRCLDLIIMIARQLSDRPAMAIFLFLFLFVCPPQRQRDPVTFYFSFSFPLKRNTFFCWAKWLIHHSPAPWILARQLGHQMLLLLFFAGCSSSASINWWNDFWMSNQVETFFFFLWRFLWRLLNFGPRLMWLYNYHTTRRTVCARVERHLQFFFPLSTSCLLLSPLQS